ncbi:helix-turn-helix domain-containing protein [Sciscionella marina]|uniref:helix-turn-helix domain-containing protein n=1 Tax=Sciscionella marina TaxID=508770 RepID=UPI0012F622E1|nr:helix-turn-helix domain-containing protein [Sciscionella marina]
MEQKVQVVLAVLGHELSIAEAACRYGVAEYTIAGWWDWFVAAGTARLEQRTPPGPDGQAGSAEVRRLRAENRQLKLALAGATVQVRIWEKSGEQVQRAPFPSLKP